MQMCNAGHNKYFESNTQCPCSQDALWVIRFCTKKHQGIYQMLRNAIIFNNIISKHFFSALILQEYYILCTVQTLNISYTKRTARD